jgi:hypothetical protein
MRGASDVAAGAGKGHDFACTCVLAQPRQRLLS